jgi:hypothetical protein
VPHVEIVLRYPDGEVETARLGAESAPADLEAGQRVRVRAVMRTVVEVLAPPA